MGKHILTRKPTKPTFLFMEHYKVGQWFCNSCGKTYSNKKHFKTHVFIHGAFYKLVSNSDILVGKHIHKRNTSKPMIFIHGAFWKLVSDSAIIVGKHIQTRNTSKPTFYSWSILKIGQWLWNSCGITYSNKNHFKTHIIIHGAL